jgi:hypothetical protein
MIIGRVSPFTRAPPFKARDTAEIETPAFWAMSSCRNFSSPGAASSE